MSHYLCCISMEGSWAHYYKTPMTDFCSNSDVMKKLVNLFRCCCTLDLVGYITTVNNRFLDVIKLWVCECVCVYVYMFMYIMHLHVCSYVCENITMCVYIHWMLECVYMQMHVCLCVHVFIHVLTSVCVNVCVYTLYMNAYVHTHELPYPMRVLYTTNLSLTT